MTGQKYVRVTLTPELQAELYENGHIRIITRGISYPLTMIIAELVRVWMLHYGKEKKERG